MDPPVNHSDFEELAAGFALGALEPDEEQAFQRHLEGCAACRTSVRDLEEVSASFAYVPPAVEPPASLRAWLRRRTGLTLRRRAARRIGTWQGTRVLARALGVAAALAALALSLWNLALRDQQQIDRARIARLEVAARMMNDSTATRVALSGSAAESGARATVLASSLKDGGVLVIEGLPQPPPGRVWELWSLPRGDFAQAAKAIAFRFRSQPGVHTVQFSTHLTPTTGFAITEEPGPAGSAHPTSDPVLLGAPPPARTGGT